MEREHGDVDRERVGLIEGLCARPRNGAAAWARTVSVDVGFCLLGAVALTALFAPGEGRLLVSLAFNFIAALSVGLSVINALRWGAPWIRVRARGPLMATGAYVFLIVTAVLVGAELAVQVVRLAGGPPPAASRSEAVRIGLIVAAIAAAVSMGYRRLREHVRRTELRAEKIQREALRAQLEVLQSRMNPHFVFNSLNTVAGLVADDPSKAESMIEGLAALFRYSLSQSQRTWVRLGDELEMVRHYLDVEGLRFGERMQTHMAVEPGSDDLLVPPLILQPLVENAVHHGVERRPGGTRVEIEIARPDRQLILRVANELAESDEVPSLGAGYAMKNVEERLRLLYGAEARLDSTREHGWYSVTVSLPASKGTVQ